MQFATTFQAVAPPRVRPQAASTRTIPGVRAWPLPLERALTELARRHGVRGLFGIDYQRARGFARLLAESLVAPWATDEELRERAGVGRPSTTPQVDRSAAGRACARRFRCFDRAAVLPETAGWALAIELAETYDEGVALAATCLDALSRAERDTLAWVLGPSLLRAELYERLFRLVRLATGAIS